MPRGALVASAAFCFICSPLARAQLSFGTGGAGGSGAWDLTTTDWWNGSQNVAWTQSGNAIFGGASAGTVTVASNPTATSMTFNTAGYLIAGSTLGSSSTGLTITTNADATISVLLLSNSGVNGSLLTKNGSGTLNVSGTNFLGAVQVNQGQYLLSGNGDLFFSNVTLANAAGVTVTLGQSSTNASMSTLSGGGTLGGIVQPDATARTVTLTLFGSGNFGGVLQDNGSGKLGLSVFASGTTQVLTNANTYSGATSISGGTLALSGNGSALNTAVTATFTGLVTLDNSGTVNANRLSDSTPFTLQGGQVQLIGNSATAVEETLGNLNYASGSSAATTPPGAAAALLTFAGATRTGHGTLSISGSGVGITGLATGSTGIVSPFITAGSEWAVVGGDGRVAAFTGYATNLNSGLSTDHVKLTASGITNLTAAEVRASLNLQNSSASNLVLDLGAAQNLGLTSGGILSSGTGANVIQNGSLTTSAGEWVITNSNNLTVSSAIQEAGGGTVLTKSGTGTLTLTGTNTYTGVTAIEKGTLVASSDVNLGNGSSVEFGGGTLKAAASFTSAKGLTNPGSLSGLIDTGGFNVQFGGANTGSISKSGLGTLTLTNAATGSTTVNQGTVALPNATSGNATLQGGTLVVAGTLTSLRVSSNSTLDLGGPGAATLTTGSFSDSPNTKLTINFGIGSSGSDLWAIGSSTSLFVLSSGSFLFEFANLGGATTGVNYPLLTYSSGPTPPTSDFAFAPDQAAAGWAGTFATSNTAVTVKFTSVPEPNAVALLLFVAAGSIPFLRRSYSGRSISR